MPNRPLLDCHLHTGAFSCDAKATLDAFVERGSEMGMAAITTTEHVDFDPNDYCYGFYDLDRHQAQRHERRVVSEDGLTVLIGAEVDYQRRYEDQARAFLAQTEFDLVIGSVHYVRGEIVFVDEFFRRPERENVEAYLDEVLNAVNSRLFDVIGHLDIVKRYGVQHYGPFDPARYAEPLDAILRACVDTGTGLEINTSGLRGPPKETFPTLPVLRRYRELGGEILTVGSDAHTADDLARGIPQALDLAVAAGFRAIALFVDRQPRWVAIE
jgi:histidinol-phosphatase (PHP family)